MARSHVRMSVPARKGRIQPFAPRCPARKNGFLTKRIAQRWARQVGLTDLSAYRCNHDGCEYWHLGHLPPIVKAGRLDRRELKPVVRIEESPVSESEPEPTDELRPRRMRACAQSEAGHDIDGPGTCSKCGLTVLPAASEAE